MANAITIPALQINGVYIDIEPNSLMFKEGFGTTTVKAQSIGGTTTAVFGLDQTDAVGSLTFVVEPTQSNIEQIQAIQNNNPNNTVQFTQGTFLKTMPKGAIINDPEYTLGADKNFTVEMKGDKIV